MGKTTFTFIAILFHFVILGQNLPKVNLAEGFYQTKQTVTFTYPNTSANLYFTTDGTEPNNQSHLFKTAVEFDTTTVFKVQAYINNTAISDILNLSYFINETPTLPVVSIITHPDNLFSENKGIYVFGKNASPVIPYYGANFWEDWEVPVSFTLFDKTQTFAFKGTFDIAIHGGSVTRSRPMKALRILAKSKYNLPNIDYKLFHNKSNTWFKRFVLRNSGSDFNEAHLRDGVLHEICIDSKLNVDASGYEPCLVFINGKYWGIHEIREKYDEYYLQSNYGLTASEIDLLEEDMVILTGDNVAFLKDFDFITENDLQNTANFQKASQLIDTESLCDYFIMETYFNNTDWPYNNIKYWKSKNAGGKWRYLMFDLDACLNSWSWSHHDYDQLGHILSNYGDKNFHVLMLESLLKNDQFRYYFINRYADLINSSFRTDNATNAILKAEHRIAPEIQRHLDRWDGQYAHWRDVLDNQVYLFVKERPKFMRDFIQKDFSLQKQVQITLSAVPQKAGYIHLNTLDIKDSLWQGIYYSDVPVHLNAIRTDSSFQFIGWKVDGKIVSNTADWTTLLPKDSNVEAIFIPTKNNIDDWVISPNPSESSLNILFNPTTSNNNTIRVFNAEGRLMYQSSIINSQSWISIPSENFAKGLYFVQFQNKVKKWILR